MAERFKALVLSTSLFGVVGSNPTASTYVLKLTTVIIIRKNKLHKKKTFFNRYVRRHMTLYLFNIFNNIILYFIIVTPLQY